MSSETRVIRPYVGGDEFQQCLSNAVLVCAEQRVEGGGEVSASLDEYLNYRFSLQLPPVSLDDLRSGAEALGVSLADIDLLVLVLAPRLRFVDVVFQSSLDRLPALPNDIPLKKLADTEGPGPRAFSAPHGGADVRIYFALNTELERRPLLPWRKGTWLGMLEFRVRSDLSGSGFVPVRLTDVDRERFGLPRDVSRFVTLEDHDPFEPDAADSALKLYVDGDLLDRLAVAASTPVGKHIQRQLFLDAASAVVVAAQARLRTQPSLRTQDVDDYRGSLVHRMVELVAGRGNDESTRAARQIAFSQLCDAPMTFLAHVEAKTGMRKDMVASFGDIG